jgi:hypothetical protein
MSTFFASSNESSVGRALSLSPSRRQLWAGRILSLLPIAALLFSASLKLSHAAGFVGAWTGHLGYAESALAPIGVLELACAVLYVVPRTAVLGAILLTGYLGGAIATHVRVGDPFLVPLLFGVLLWLGLYLRDRRLRDLAPLMR